MEKELEASRKGAQEARPPGKAVRGQERENVQEATELLQAGATIEGIDLQAWVDTAGKAQAVEKRLEEPKPKVAAAQSAKKLAFIQCVGSRDFRFNKLLLVLLLHALRQGGHDRPRARRRKCSSSIFCMDLRAVGRGFEEYKLRGGKQSNIEYIRGRVAEITEDEAHNPIVWYESTTSRQVVHEAFDLVVLATACVPTAGTTAMAKLLGVELDENGFFKTDPLMPLEHQPARYLCVRLCPGTHGYSRIGGSGQQRGRGPRRGGRHRCVKRSVEENRPTVRE